MDGKESVMQVGARLLFPICGPNVSGPRVCILAGTHGDELIGMEVLRHLLGAFGVPVPTFPVTAQEAARAFLEWLGSLQEAERMSRCSDAISGTLVLGIGNPAAVYRGTRAASDGIDLNRCFFEERLRDTSEVMVCADLIRAREIAPVLERCDALLDLHSFRARIPGGAPLVCFGRDDAAHRNLYQRFPVERILTDPDNVLGSDVRSERLATTDAWVDAHGGVGLCYETGYDGDFSRVKETVAVAARFLVATGVTDQASLHELGLKPFFGIPRTQRVFRLAHCEVARYLPGFTYADGMMENWRCVQSGEYIGGYADGHGDSVYAPRSGCLVLQTPPEKVVPGRSLFYLAESVDPTK
ncbi:succinylglutamate desuccinylase/aspartoacylase family protein [Candidatus Uhrbacteria bacterium]|nr:succinylglutamate desuccinylase/aspartoacylase family protein [Candidatus Uhrbacteria bacterium]